MIIMELRSDNNLLSNKLIFNFLKSHPKFDHITMEYVQNDIKNFFVELDGGKITGFVSFTDHDLNKKSWTKDPRFQRSKCLSLEQLLVNKEYQKKGIGSKLVSKVIDYGIKNGYTNLIMSTQSSNKEFKNFITKKFAGICLGTHKYSDSFSLDIYTVNISQYIV